MGSYDFHRLQYSTKTVKNWLVDRETALLALHSALNPGIDLFLPECQSPFYQIVLLLSVREYAAGRSSTFNTPENSRIFEEVFLQLTGRELRE